MDELKDLYNQTPGMFSALSDPFTIREPATIAATKQYGGSGEVGGKADALRHLLGAATLAKRQGQDYAETALNWHENPNIPQFLGGGYGQRAGDRAMDLHNNALGLEIARKAKTYDEALAMARQHINQGKVKYSNEDYSKPVNTGPRKPDIIDQIFEHPVDLIRSMFSK